jgi:hypothetical protein
MGVDIHYPVVFHMHLEAAGTVAISGTGGGEDGHVYVFLGSKDRKKVNSEK